MKKILFGFLVLCISTSPLIAQDDVTSPSDNVPPKKEGLADKTGRYEAAGYKIGVVFYTPDLFVVQPRPTMMAGEPGAEKMVTVLIKETEPVCECFADMTDDVVSKLNAQYGTSIFEDIDVSAIPKRTVLGMTTEDWWNTKYKAVVHVTVGNQYSANYLKSKKKLTAIYSSTLTFLFMEYINEKKGKQKVIAQTAGGFFSELYEAEVEKIEGLSLADLKTNVGAPTNEQLTDAYESSYKETIDNFMEKLKKKK